MKNLKTFLLVSFVLLILTACGSKPEESHTPSDSVINTPEPAKIMEEATTIEEDGTVIFKLTGQNFKFILAGTEGPDLIVKQGDKVRIELTSADGYHDWVVDEFDAATKKVNTGESTSVEFVADQAGTFEYYCSVGEHRASGMRGNLIVQ